MTVLRACADRAAPERVYGEGWPRNLVAAKQRKLERKGWVHGWGVTELGLMVLTALEAAAKDAG